MGIESDRLVFDYLSRVGDLAQTALPAADRMRLVARLRNDIDTARGKTAGDSPASVRRILGRFGTPDEIVAAAAEASPYGGRDAWRDPRPAADGPGAGRPPSPAPRTPAADPPIRPAPETAPDAPAGPFGLFRKAPPRPAPDAATPGGPVPGVPVGGGPADGPARPRTAEGRPGAPATEWWRATPGDGRVNEILSGGAAGPPGPVGGIGAGAGDIGGAGGWTGGLIMSEFQRAAGPAADAPGAPVPGAPPAPGAAVPPAAPPAGATAPVRRAPRLPAFLRKPQPTSTPEAGAAAPARRRGLSFGPVEVLAAAGLIAGAVMGNLILLAAGWILAYTTRGLSRKQSGFATLGLPGIVLLGAFVWFWGRATGHWGAPMSGAQLNAAVGADFPVVLKVAAVASALYLLWRGVLRRG